MEEREKLVDLFGERPFETLVTEIRDFAIFHIDRTARIVSWNEGAFRITGFTEKEMIGASFSDIFTPEDRVANVPEKELVNAERDGRAEDRRWHLRKDGSRFFADGVTTALRDAGGRLLGFAKIARDETHIKLTEDALVESTRRISNVLESISDAFYILDPDWKFTYINRQAELLLERETAELIGKTVWNEFPEAVESAFFHQFHRATSEHVTVTFEEYYQPLQSWFEVRAYPSTDGLSVYFRNISDRKQIEASRLERSRIDALVTGVASALVQNEPLGALLYQCVELLVENPDVAFARIWTYNRPEEMLELVASAGLYTHLDGPHSRVPLGKYKIGEIAAERVPHKTNDVPNDPRVSDKAWAIREGMRSFAGYPLVVGERLVGVIAVFGKIEMSRATIDTLASVSNAIAGAIDRKQIEESLLQSEQQYRIVAETAHDAIISIDESSTILFINRSCERIFGYTPEELIGQKLTILMPESFRPAHLAGLDRYLETGIRHLQWDHVEIRGRHRDGHEFPIELSFGEFRTPNRHEFIGIARDISNRARAEALVRESEEKFSTLAEAVPQLVWMADVDGSIFWYNQNWYRYTGTRPEDMAGWGWESVHDPQMLPLVKERWIASIESGEPFEMEFPLRGADGQLRWFLTRVNPFRGTDGKIVRWFGTNTDVDEQRRLDQRNRFVIAIDEAVRPLTSPEEITLTLARLLGEHIGADRCAYAHVEADEDHFYIPGDYTRGDTPSIVGRYSMSQFGQVVLRLMRENKPYVVDDVDHDPQVTEEDLAAYRLTGIKAVICVPLHKNGKFSACMAVHQRVPRHWRSSEVELVTFVANRFWEAIERARILKSLELALASEKDARQAAESANRVKDEFLATVSHELRTPLNAILGWSSMLNKGSLSADDTKRALQTVERNARSQAKLIDDLLDISRIITGKLRLEIDTFDLSSVIDAAIDAVQPAADATKIQLHKSLDSGIGPISGDAARLQQVIWNLLSNAVKFTPKGGSIEVRTQCADSHVEIAVTDNGKGIEPEFLPFVFDRFRQEDQSRTRRQGGLGLGLSIVRQLVEMHGGVVTVTSAGLDEGTTFIVKLPRMAALHPASIEPSETKKSGFAEDTEPDCAPELTDLRVLVVDDEQDSLDLVRKILEQCGAVAQTTTSAAGALAHLAQGAFDVLVSDIGMPDEDGYSLIRRIRSMPRDRGGQIPAIALTAYARVEDRLQALASGFQGYLAKPVEPAELAAAISSVAVQTDRESET
ncbi:MAG: PAS domain S-box protein [Pyrinomonadaceae bacterium]